ncbi:unnamed protein product [Rotaria sordida]|uniref:EF-hand domain-containing protein n=1 Tax=Rotaria sordida TaxID=392033 RepID=A0A815GJP7_9BILA|nr:unnamed protein product [Rotaria sordida]
MGNKHPKIPKQEELTRKRIHYLKKITKFSEAEIQDWHVGFFQDCPDGKLNKETLTKEYKRYYGEHQANIFCDYVFKIFDKNRDDSISFNEFLIAVSTRGQGRLRDRLGLIFDMYDSSRDKKLDTKELTALITAMVKLLLESKNDHVTVFEQDLSQLFDQLKEFIFVDICGIIPREKVEPYRLMAQTRFPNSRIDVQLTRFCLWI